MKKLILLVAASVIALSACDDSDSPVGPVMDESRTLSPAEGTCKPDPDVQPC
ncbi:MAG: hypothetical protein ABR559_04490 [Gemmatimonadota bacterium]